MVCDKVIPRHRAAAAISKSAPRTFGGGDELVQITHRLPTSTRCYFFLCPFTLSLSAPYSALTAAYTSHVADSQLDFCRHALYDAHRHILTLRWKDKVKNTAVLSGMAEKEPRFYKNIARQKMAYAGHVLRGSSGLNVLLIMEGKISGVKARRRPRRAWTDDLKDWTELRNYSELKRTAQDRTI